MATSPGSGWASGPLSSGKHRGGNGVWRFPITLSERGAHRGVVGGVRSRSVGATRCSARDDARVSTAFADHKRTSTTASAQGRMDLGRAGRRRRARGRRDRATGSREAGHRVLVVEKKRFPREKTCGDGLTPRAVRQLEDMGLGPQLSGSLRYDGLRSIAHGVTLELEWPEHPDFPDYGYVVRRRDLDEMVADAAAGAGAEVWTGAEAVAPLVDDGLVVGARGAARRRRGAGAGPLRGGGRRRELPLRAGAGLRPRPHLSPRHGGAGLLHQPVPRRALDREPPRPPRPRRQPPPRLRLDLPGGRRHRERGRRPAVHVLGVEVDQHQHADGRVRRHRAGALGHLARDLVRRARPAGSCRPADRSRRTSARRGWWSATPPVR